MNILPQPQKEELQKGLRLRIVIVSLWAAFATLVIGSLLLLPAYIIASARLVEIKESGQINTENFEEQADLLKTPQIINKKASLVLQISPKESAAARIIGVSAASDRTVTINKISYQKDPRSKSIKPVFTMVVAGVAQNRDSLSRFESSVRNLDFIKRTLIPVGDYARDKDLNFTMTVEIGE